MGIPIGPKSKTSWNLRLPTLHLIRIDSSPTTYRIHTEPFPNPRRILIKSSPPPHRGRIYALPYRLPINNINVASYNSHIHRITSKTSPHRAPRTPNKFRSMGISNQLSARARPRPLAWARISATSACGHGHVHERHQSPQNHGHAHDQAHAAEQAHHQLAS